MDTRVLPETLYPVIVVPLFFVLSGLLGWWLGRPLREVRMHSVAERLLLYVILGVVAFSWLGTVLAATGLFRWPVLLLVLASIVLIPVLRRVASTRPRQQGAPPASSPPAEQLADPPADVAPVQATPRLVVVIVCLLLLGAIWLYSRPAESFLVVDDSAVYTIGSVVLARTGSLTAEPAVFWRTTEDFSRTFMVVDAGLIATRHVGPFYQWTGPIPSVEIGYLPLPKVWMAVAVWLFGAGHATWATPFFGVLGIALLYGITRRAWGWPAGLAALLLLGISLPQVWFARYPLSEVYTQALLLGAVYLAVLARANAARPRLARLLALWSGLALATMSILRFEGLLLIVLLAALMLAAWRRIPRDPLDFQRVWIAALSLGSAYGLAISAGAVRHYFVAQTLGTLTPNVTRVALLGLGAALAVAVWLWLRKPAWPRALLERAVNHLPLALGGLWLAWVALVLWQAAAGRWPSALPGWIAGYWTRPGLAIAAVGLGFVLWEEHRRKERPEVLAFLGLAILLLLMYTANPAVNPVQPWGMRRLMPAIMPALAVGTAVGIVGLASYAGRLLALQRLEGARFLRAALAFVAVLLVAAITAGLTRISMPLWQHQELRGFYSSAQAVADSLPSNAVLLFDDGLVGERLTQVFEFVFGRPSLSIRLAEVPATHSELDALIQAAHEQGRPVFLALTGGDLAWWPDKWQLKSAGVKEIQTATVRQVRGRPPNASDVANVNFRMELYEVLPASQAASVTTLPMDVPIGEGSYTFLREGFKPWSLDADGKETRWTNGDALAVVPWPGAAGAPAEACLELTVAGGRTAADEPAMLTVNAEERQLYAGQLPSGFGPQLLKLPIRDVQNHGLDGLELRLKSNTWRPNDGEELGVLVEDIELLPLAACGQ